MRYLWERQVYQFKRGLVAEMKSLLTRKQLQVYGNCFPGGINELNIDDVLKLCERTLDKAVADEAIKRAGEQPAHELPTFEQVNKS